MLAFLMAVWAVGRIHDKHPRLTQEQFDKKVMTTIKWKNIGYTFLAEVAFWLWLFLG